MEDPRETPRPEDADRTEDEELVKDLEPSEEESDDVRGGKGVKIDF